MGTYLSRTVMALVGIAILVTYTALAIAGLYAIDWFISNPPSPVTFLITFGIVAFLGAYIGYRSGIVRLAASLNARELSHQRAPAVYRRLERLCEQMSVTQPPILLADLDAPNALSIGGPREGAIILDRRLLRLLTIEELEGILAHELAHMEQYDTFLNTLVITVTRLLVGIVYVFFLPFVIFLAGIDRAAGWIAGEPQRWQFGLSGLFRYAIGLFLVGILSIGTLLFLAHSRRQEYRADNRAAAVTENPVALARALSKIHRATEPHRGLRSILYIHDDPQEQRHRLLSTHPPIDERIGRLLDRTDTDLRRQHVGRLRP